MTQEDAHRLELAMASMQRTMETGFATVEGRVNLLLRGEEYNVRETQEHDVRIKALEDRRFPLPTIGGIMGVAGVGVSLVALLKGG